MTRDWTINREVWEGIQSDFDRVVLWSQDCGVSKLQTDALFTKWATQKAEFFKAFGNQLIYRSPEPVTIKLSKEAKKQKIGSFIEYLESYNRDLAAFVEANQDDFFDNTLKEKYVYGDKTISKGMKITRAFKYFESDARLLDAFQTKASMILQEDKVSGYLHLSIHPLDYLTTSENIHKWRSCHALDGEYRAGNLAYMCDASTVVAYIADDEPVNIPQAMPADMKWNSKKWRVLLFFSDSWNMMFAGRQYPFSTESGLEAVRDMVLKTIWRNSEYWDAPTPWFNDSVQMAQRGGEDVKLCTSYYPIRNKLYDILDNRFMEEKGGGIFYNDLRYSSIYKKPYYCYLANSAREVHFTIGADVPCLICGRDHLFTSGSMFCHDCEIEYGSCDDPDYFAYCAICGRRVLVDEAYGVENGDRLCEYCAETATMICESCGTRCYNEDMHYDKKSGEYRCSWCYEERGEY